MVNKANIFDICTQYATLDTNELGKLIKDEVNSNYAWYEETFGISLRMKGIPFKKWIRNQGLRSVAGDELMIYTRTRPWTTYNVKQPVSIEDLYNQSASHFMYLGGGIFGLIHPRLYTIPMYRPVNLIIAQQLTSVVRSMGPRKQTEPLDLSVPRDREIVALPQVEEPIEITKRRQAHISAENAALIEARAHPLMDITGSDSENNVPKSRDNQNLHIIEPVLEYLMETSPFEPLLGGNLQENLSQPIPLPDVTPANSPVDTRYDQYNDATTSMASPTERLDYTGDDDT